MIRILRRAAVPTMLAVVAVAAASPGCSKEKQSLVLAELDFGAAGEPAVSLGSLTLVATPGPTRAYDLTKLSAVDGAVFGLYTSGDITGSVKIDATAYPLDGSCAGYKGSNHVSIAAAGVTTQVVITMDATDVCTPSGTGGTGAAGTSGGAGMTGSAGRGGSAGGGNGGTAGSAGTTGTAGTGGTTGSAGRGGTTGTAGTGGSAGTTGSAGRGGTTGTAGMAGYPSISACRTFSHAATTGCTSVSVNSVAISPNGQFVATGGDDARVKIWSFDGRTLTQTGTFLPGFNGYTVVFSPDGTRLAYTSNLTSTTVGVRTYLVSGWAASTVLQDNGSGNTLRGVGFTPDSQRVVSVNAFGFAGGDLFVHNIGGSALPAYTAHVTNEPYTLAVSPRAASDGTVAVAVGSYYDTTTVYALGASGFAATSKDIASSMTGRTTYSVEFSPDGSQLVTGESYGAVRFFAYPLATPPAPVGSTISFAGGDSVNDVTFAPNGMFLAVGGGFSTKQLSIYNVATHAEVDRTTPAADVESIAFAPNGNAIIAGLDDCGSVLVCSP